MLQWFFLFFFNGSRNLHPVYFWLLRKNWKTRSALNNTLIGHWGPFPTPLLILLYVPFSGNDFPFYEATFNHRIYRTHKTESFKWRLQNATHRRNCTSPFKRKKISLSLDTNCTPWFVIFYKIWIMGMFFHETPLKDHPKITSAFGMHENYDNYCSHLQLKRFAGNHIIANRFSFRLDSMNPCVVDDRC